MKHSLILMASLLVISVTLHTMEITDQGFVLKQKNYGLKGYFYPTQDTSRLLPSFKTTADSDSSFANRELMWWSGCKTFPEDIKNVVLKIRYRQIMNNNKHLRSKSIKFSKILPIFGLHDINKDIFWLNKSQQQALYFLLNKPEIETIEYLDIEGADIEFLQEMVKQIDSFPKELKQSLVESCFQNTYYIQTSEPSFFNACLGQNQETRTTNVNRLAKIAGYASCGLIYASSMYACSKVEDKDIEVGIIGGLLGTTLLSVGVTAIAKPGRLEEITKATLAHSLIGASAVVIVGGRVIKNEHISGAGAGVALVGTATLGSIAAGEYVNDYIWESLNPTNYDELMALRGFEKKYFLPELEDNH